MGMPRTVHGHPMGSWWAVRVPPDDCLCGSHEQSTGFPQVCYLQSVVCPWTAHGLPMGIHGRDGHATDRSWASHGQLMSSLWAIRGLHTGSPWAFHAQLGGSPFAVCGRSIGIPWAVHTAWASHRKFMACPWACNGQHMDSSWAVHRQSMGVLRTAHGIPMNCPWASHGYSTGIPWTVY